MGKLMKEDDRDNIDKTRDHEYSITDIFYFIFRMKWVILLIAIICGITGYYYSILTYRPYYTATSSMVVNIKASTNSEGYQAVSPDQIYLAQKLIDTYMVILKSKRVMQSVINDLKLKIPPQTVESYITLVPAKDTSIIYVYVNCEDPALAMNIANSLMKVAPSAMIETVETGSVNVLDRAALPVLPTPVDYYKYILIGAGAGIGIGIILALCTGTMLPKVRSVRDLEERLDIAAIGEIPHAKRKVTSYEMIYNENCKNVSYAQSLMMMSNIVHFIAENQNVKTIAVTSAIKGEGKTSTAVNMAFALSRLEKSVLLIDCDFRNPTIKRIFDITNSLGLLSLLQNANIYDCIIKHPSGIHLLPVCESIKSPVSVSFGDTLKQFFDVMKNYYDYIIIDTSPAFVVSDSALISSYADSVVLVVKHLASLNVMSETYQGLKKCGANVIGCVLNNIKTTAFSKYKYRSKYYKEYYENYTL